MATVAVPMGIAGVLTAPGAGLFALGHDEYPGTALTILGLFFGTGNLGVGTELLQEDDSDFMKLGVANVVVGAGGIILALYGISRPKPGAVPVSLAPLGATDAAGAITPGVMVDVRF